MIMIDSSKTRKSLAGIDVQSPFLIERRSKLFQINTYCPKSVLSVSDDPGTYFPAARFISLISDTNKKQF